MKIFGIKIRYIIIGAIVIVGLVSIGVLFNQSRMAKWRPDASLAGKWIGTADYKGTDESPLAIEIIIKEDGTVEGTVGEATLSNCEIILNRNDFERMINVKTDYYITGGTLSGAISDEEVADEWELAFPFDIEGSYIKGTLFHKEGWKYPYPFGNHVKLYKIYEE